MLFLDKNYLRFVFLIPIFLSIGIVSLAFADNEGQTIDNIVGFCKTEPRVARKVVHPFKGAIQKQIPTVTLYNQNPGCYVACYSRNPDKAVYPVAQGIYLVGQLRVRGSYNGVMCTPENYETRDIRGEQHFKEICSK